MELLPPRTPARSPAGISPDNPTWQVAQKLETAFLSEMLKAAEPRISFMGGSDDTQTSQFSSFLRQAQVEGISNAGGIGLAQQLFESLNQRIGDVG